ncbi:hemolysin XhlA family protein [Metabacillus litoralis]|uniref:hemolysin XhlA family protein n=1 Tax=Metabacillus litoralis TaxID=152268 RepID=UPI00203AA693|nr:hemolysin XhlA family protein [Metabacillus litoralis]MCM3651341.1 hemolysin XhlA family protein [Metabacillus litoralis]
MSNTVEVEPEMNAFEKDIVEMKGDIKSLQKEMVEVQSKGIRHDEQIQSINKALDSIEDNTKWIRRTITGAIITAICTGVIGGAIAIFYVVLQR